MQDDSLVYKKNSRVERILDLTLVPSSILGLQQKVMHYLSNLNFIIQADVYKMKIEKFFQWGRIVDTMRLWAERDNTEIIGVSHLQSQDDAWKQKKGAMLAILDALASLLKEEDKNGFHCLYWALKTYGMICMDFKDLEEAKQVFRRLKHEC